MTSIAVGNAACRAEPGLCSRLEARKRDFGGGWGVARRSRRTTVLRFKALAVLSVLMMLPACWAQTVEGVATSLTGNADRMISYRHQQHSWMTSDGHLHLMVNTGVPQYTGGANGLTLYSSADNGVTWTADLSLPRTKTFSTSDGILVPNTDVNGVVVSDDLSVVYSTNDIAGVEGGSILYTVLHYDETQHSWSLTNTTTIFDASTSTVAGLNPAIVIDTANRIWCSYVNEQKIPAVIIPPQNPPYPYSNIKLIVGVTTAPGTPNAPVWRDTGLIFGPSDNQTRNVERSARPVLVAGGVGMVYTVHQNFYWTRRLDGWSVMRRWTAPTTIFTSFSTDPNPYESHFSIVSDAQQNLHMVFGDNGLLRYMTYADNQQAWNDPQTLTTDSSLQVAYPKISLIQGSLVQTPVLVIAFNDSANVDVWQSTDNGQTFPYTTQLLHDNFTSDPNADFSHPRVELPAYMNTLTIPVLQQYADGPTNAPANSQNAVLNKALSFQVVVHQ